MRKRNLLIRAAAILTILLLIFLYLVFYFFPTVKSINLLKREVKDLNLKMADFGEIESNFSFPDEKEKQYFTAAEKETKREIRQVRGKGDINKLVTAVSGYLQKRAQKDGVTKLTIKHEIDSPAVILRDNLKYRNINLSFSADLQSGLNFINHIPYGNFRVSAGRVTLSGSQSSLLFSVAVRIYYFAGKAAASPPEPGGVDETGLEIDADSEALLVRVYTLMPGEFRRRELPREFGAIPLL